MEVINSIFANRHCSFFLVVLLLLASTMSLAIAEIHHHDFVVQATKVKRLCKTHNSITVNGMFPGPTLEVKNGDTLVVKVVNKARYNVTIHWHGIRQMRTGWADGPEFVTQCPIRPGGSYTYRFTIEGQEGTLWWHAHSSWLRATVYGALIIHPREGSSYPFAKPKRETPILLGNYPPLISEFMIILTCQLELGAAPNISDAYTINGQPGDLYNCSSEDTAIVPIDFGESNLLRVINAALNQPLFFTVANHKFTVVGADASYLKPFTTSVIMLGPGQTTDVLISGDQLPGRYYMAARAYQSAQNAPFDNTTTTAILEYKSALCPAKCTTKPSMPQLPAYNDTATVTAFSGSLRSPRKVEVPTDIDENLFFTFGLGLNNCPKNFRARRCQGPNGTRFTASMNNVSFVFPSDVALLQAYHHKVPGIFTTDFPASPTSKIRLHWAQALSHQKTIQSIFMDTTSTSLQKVAVPANGWAVIRFVADNPGVWLMHCHLDVHITWGLAMAFLVENGIGELQSVEPPPADLPIC
ncbi:MULTI-COPPER OXIDASE [Salix koriyanagi]|uniref:Laccase n=1 Tax=Salix koriyanagi TaxID=2511006 RepID=A0A9Q1AIM2_9ROSI|nr:MULTI-COPPER OXIDASE [Salix koriyanagi]